ncbi:hypothetical protein RJ639_018528 [Escallonia herrerae]|uniref:F-box domain-containing protein n=1 Tax=Escallonia herrerae TaxID=1293975 RepID=A0AA89AIG6_9ASTE|nr:hypothetical protein RJ639_018528 [Escallonia herrerae]
MREGSLGSESETSDKGDEGFDYAFLFLEQLDEAKWAMLESEGFIPPRSGAVGSSSVDGAASSSGQGARGREVNLNLGLGEEPSSSAVVGDDVESCNCDSQSKRPKVHSFSLDWDWNSACDMLGKDYNPNKSSFRNENYRISSISNGGNNDNLLDSTNRIDEIGEGSNTLTMEDSEIRMDLTDDLLHMVSSVLALLIPMLLAPCLCVFSFLDHINLCRAAKVCRQWRTASSHEDFWKFLNFENWNVSLEQWHDNGASSGAELDAAPSEAELNDRFEDMCCRYPNAIEVNINGAPAIHLLVMKATSSLRNLEVLTMGKGQVGESFFTALTDCQKLKSLIVNDATLGNGIQEILVYHDRLRLLHIVKCRVLRISIRCPQLQTLSLKRSSMAHAVLNCPLLQDLDIASCHKLSDAAIRSAAISCQLLESLDMSNCSCVSDETLREIANSCGNLHNLNASYCPNISLESVRLPMLTVLKLHSCEGITSASMVAISHSYMLEVLELDNCSLLTSVLLDLPCLQNIRLVHCRKFVELNLQSTTLSSIKVSNCPLLQRINITAKSLRSLTTVGFCSTSLVNLSLAGCRAITCLEINCPYLEQVSLDGCDHLERATFCPVGLRSLNLGICPKLSALHIEAPHLALLELKGCGVLSEAAINCPLLTSLDASFCSQLKDECLSATTASCPRIESLILMSCPAVGSVGLLSLHWLPQLTLLDLSYTFLMNLQPVFESCLQLKVLKLQACKYLSGSSLEPLYKEGALPSLRDLDLSYGTLCQSAIEELLACCTHLTHVSLNGCVNMHDLNWGFIGDQLSELPNVYGLSSSSEVDLPIAQPNLLLQNLNCVGCQNIKKVYIPLMAQCLHLSSLNLSLSANLKEVDIVCLNLCFLNMSNCCSLEILKLECPRLSSLFLQSCNIDEEAVEVAISECNMLETLDVRFCPKIFPLSMGRLRAACSSLKRIYSSLSPT